MKKTVVLILFFMLMLPIFASAEVKEAGYCADYSNFYIEGKTKSGSAGDNVSLLILDANGEIKYIEQYKTDGNHSYRAKFKLDNYENTDILSVKEGNCEIASGVTVKLITNPNAFYSVSIVNENYSAVLSENDFIKLITDNKYIDVEFGKFIVAYYSEDGKMIGCEQIDGGSSDGIVTAAVCVPKNAEFVKAFLWSKKSELKPMSEAAVKKVGDKRFSGDNCKTTVAFIGDSITQMAEYLPLIEHYYQTRYPDKDIDFVNKGISGNTVQRVIDRFDWDITEDYYSGKINEATLMIGMNDIVSGASYPNGTQGAKDAAINNCISGVEKVIKLCHDKHISLTLITPTAYDETEYETETVAEIGRNSYGMKNFSEKLKALAEKYDVPIIDLWTATTDKIAEMRKKGYKGFVVTGPDRIHLRENGGFYVAYEFIKQQEDGGAVVASVNIDASNGSFAAENADILLTSIAPNRIEYRYSPKATPIAYTDAYKNAEEVLGCSVTEDINQEMIKVIGLDSGSYTLTMDNALIGTYTSEQFAEGINIALNENNPGQIKAKNSFNVGSTAITNHQSQYKQTDEYAYRGIALTEQQMKNNHLSTKDELNANGPQAWIWHYEAYFGNSGFGAKVNQDATWKSLKESAKKAGELAKPGTYNVVINKAN